MLPDRNPPLRSAAGLLLCLGICSSAAGQATTTERLWLSGTGRRDTVDWEFRCEAHPRCRSWTTIPVPSQWELEGMGHYDYGHDRTPHHDVGHYRVEFTPPAHWRGWRVDLVFEGVMTDAEVLLNGIAVGEHRGGFYRFRFAVEKALLPGSENRLEVTVRDAAGRGVARVPEDRHNPHAPHGRAVHRPNP